MLDPTLSTASLAALETTLNAALRYDPGTRLALEKLQGQVFALASTAPAFNLYLIFQSGEDDEAVRLQGQYEGEVTTQLRGPLPALLQIAFSDTTSLSNSGVEVMGSTALLSNLQRIFADMDIDWEEALSQLLGDVLGHEAAQQIRHRLGWAGQRLSSGKRLISEYLTEEMRSLPAKAELEHFYAQVSELRMGSDRLNSRIEQLKQRIAARHPSPGPHKE